MLVGSNWKALQMQCNTTATLPTHRLHSDFTPSRPLIELDPTSFQQEQQRPKQNCFYVDLNPYENQCSKFDLKQKTSGVTWHYFECLLSNTEAFLEWYISIGPQVGRQTIDTLPGVAAPKVSQLPPWQLLPLEVHSIWGLGTTGYYVKQTEGWWMMLSRTSAIIKDT